jgi:hypothetical protein
MNKLLIALLATAVFVGLMVAGYFFFIKKDSESEKNNDSETFTLLKETGEIMYKESEGDDYVNLNKSEIELESGSFVKTDLDTFAQVILPNNSVVSIDELTEIQIEFEEDSTNIDQLTGNTWHRVKSLSSGDSYEVKTPNTIASVRGTIFSVGVNETFNYSEIHVADSIVQVSQYEEVDGEIEILGEADVETAGYVNVNDLSDELVIEAVPEDFQDTNWYKRNKALDEQIDLDDFNLRDFKNILDENSLSDFDLGEAGLNNNDIPTEFSNPDFFTADQFGGDYSELCTFYDPSLYAYDENYWSTMGQYYNSDYVNLLRNYFDTMYQGCEDGTFDTEELKNLEEIGKQFENIDYNSIYKYDYSNLQ